MRVLPATTSKKTVTFRSSRKMMDAVISLQRTEQKTLVKGEYVVLKCRMNPSDSTSQTYDLPVPYFKTGTPEEYLKWRSNVDKGMKGYGATTGPSKYSFTRRLLEGDALAVFDLKRSEYASETNENYQETMEHLGSHVFPTKALQKQKRYMRRVLRKPRDLTTRDYVARVCEINNLLASFPGADENSKLPEDELLDILEFGMPNSWQRAMTLQDFDPVEHTVSEFVSFCERLEATDTEDVIPKKKEDKNSSNSSSKKRKPNTQNGGSGLDCILHGDNCGHTTHDCRNLRAQAEKMKQKYKSKSSSGVSKETQAIFQEAMAAFTKKQKAKKKKAVEKELQAFENLSVTSDLEHEDEGSHTGDTDASVDLDSTDLSR